MNLSPTLWIALLWGLGVESAKQKGHDWESSQGLYLITDRQRRRVYVILRWG